MSSEKDEFLKRVFAIAFTESLHTTHTTVDVPDVARSFFTKVNFSFVDVHRIGGSVSNLSCYVLQAQCYLNCAVLLCLTSLAM